MEAVGTLILILLLLAAIFGVLGAVLKLALILVLSAILAMVLLTAVTVWYLRSRVLAAQRELQRRVHDERRRREAYDVRIARDEPGGAAGELGDGRG